MAEQEIGIKVSANFEDARQELLAFSRRVKETAEEVKNGLGESMDSAKKSGDALADTVKDVSNEVKDNLNNAAKTANVSAAQLATTFQQVVNGLRQIVQGQFVNGIRTISRGFFELKANLVGVKTGAAEAGTELAEATAKAGGFAKGLGAMGVAGIAAGVAIVAAFIAVKLAIDAVIGTAEKLLDISRRVGTQSQDDFLKMRRAIEDVGGRLTFIDQLLSQRILRASADVKSAFDVMWLNVLRESGPSLVRLLNEVTTLVVALGPVAANVGKFITFHIDGITAAIRFARVAFLEFKVLAASGRFMTPEVRKALLAPPKKALLGGFLDPNEDFVLTDPQGTDTPGGGGRTAKQAAQDMTELELAMNRLKRVTEDTREAFGVSLNAIEEDFKSGADSAEVFFQRVVAEETLFVERLRQLLAEERKIILARPTLPRQKLNELEELAAKEAAIVNASAARVVEADRKAIEALQKAHEERDKLIDKETEALEKSKQQWAKYADDVTQQLIKIHNQEVDNEAARERMRQAQQQRADDEIRLQQQQLDPTSNINIFGVDPLGELTKLEALKAGGMAALGTLNQAVGTFGGLMKNSLLGVAAAAQQVLATFILTGKLGGAAFKQLAANIIAELIVMSAVKAIFHLAEGFADLAWGNAYGASMHFAAAKLYGIVAGAAAVAGGVIGASGGLQGGGGGSVGSEFAADQRRPSETRVQQRDGFQFIPGEGNAFQQMVATNQEQADGIRELNRRLELASPGDVLTRGINQRPEAVPTGVRQALRSDQGFVRDVALATQRG